MTIQLSEVMNMVLLPEQMELVKQFDEGPAIETVLEFVLIEAGQIDKTELVARVTRTLEPLDTFFGWTDGVILENQVGFMVRSANHGGFIDLLPDGTARLTTNGKEYAERKFEMGLFKEFIYLLQKVERQRNLM